MWNWEDECFEPNEFDEKIEELKDELRDSVKKEIKDEIEKLRKENKKLQGIKKNFESVKKDFERKKDECDRAIQAAEYKAKQARLKELMEHYKVILWSVDRDYKYTVDDECGCRACKLVYHPRENVLYELAERNRKVKAWYKKKGDEGEEYYVADACSKYAKVIVDHNKDFKKIEGEELRKVFFTTKEECQEFCDYINKRNEIEGYDYDLDGHRLEW